MKLFPQGPSCRSDGCKLLPLGLSRVETLSGESTEATVQVQVDFFRGCRNGRDGLRVCNAEADFLFVLIFLEQGQRCAKEVELLLREAPAGSETFSFWAR